MWKHWAGTSTGAGGSVSAALTKKRYYYYAHLRKNYPFQSNLKEGSAVQAGDASDIWGAPRTGSKENTNNIEESHLHFGLELVFDESQKER